MMRTTDQPDAGAQTVSSVKSAASMISRREAIRRAALLAGVALSPELFTFVGRAQTAAAKTYLSAAQGAIARAVADRILPRTDTPGAVDVGVPAFIDLLYGEFMSPAEQKLLIKSLDDVEAAAKSAHGASFATLTAAQQDGVLRSVATAQQGTRGAPLARCARSRSSATSRPSRSARTCCTTIPSRAPTTGVRPSIRSAGATGRRRVRFSFPRRLDLDDFKKLGQACEVTPGCACRAADPRRWLLPQSVDPLPDGRGPYGLRLPRPHRHARTREQRHYPGEEDRM